MSRSQLSKITRLFAAAAFGSLAAGPARGQFEPFFDLFGIDPGGRPQQQYDRPYPHSPAPGDPRGNRPPATPYEAPSEQAPYRGETQYLTVPTGPPPRGAVPVVTSKGPHVGRWTIWRSAEPESGNKPFPDGQSCVDAMARLAVEFRTQVELTCENNKEIVVAYESCKPAADGFPYCVNRMRPAPRPKR